MKNFKSQLANPHSQTLAKKQQLFNLIYKKNFQQKFKDHSHLLQISKAMFDLWRDSLAPQYNSQSELLEAYSQYLLEQKLVPNADA